MVNLAKTKVGEKENMYIYTPNLRGYLHPDQAMLGSSRNSHLEFQLEESLGSASTLQVRLQESSRRLPAYILGPVADIVSSIQMCSLQGLVNNA